MKTVLITGASSGIGKSTATCFAANDWNVVATMRSPEACKDFRQISDIVVTRLDVEDVESIADAIALGITEFGSIDAVINNAGYGQYGIFESISSEEIRKQFDVNLFGVMNVTRAILPHFRARRSGVFVNVSSGVGRFTLPMMSSYAASKFALEGYSEALSYELLAHKINVKLVIPHGGVNHTHFSERATKERDSRPVPSDYAAFADATNQAYTRMPAPRSTTADEVAKTIYRAAIDETDQLRYYIGNDTRGFLRARLDLDDEAYVAYMRKHFP